MVGVTHSISQTGTEAQRSARGHTAGENLSWIQLKSLGLSVTQDSLLETSLGCYHVLKGSAWNQCVKWQVIDLGSQAPFEHLPRAPGWRGKGGFRVSSHLHCFPGGAMTAGTTWIPGHVCDICHTQLRLHDN